MTAATETRRRFQAKRRHLQKQVDTQARTLAGYWKEREELLSDVRRWRTAFYAAAPFAVGFAADLIARVLR